MRRRLLYSMDVVVVLATLGLYLGEWYIFRLSSADAPVWASFAGRFHIALLHLPIGVLMVLAAAEALAAVKDKAPAPTFYIGFAALTTYLTTAAGLLLAWEGGYNERLLLLHQIGGSMTAFFVGAALLIRLRVDDETGARRGAYRVALWLGALAAGAAGHFGGSMTHGEGYLTELAGDTWNAFREVEQTEAVAEGPTVYAEVIVPILEEKCYRCHSGSKKKHGLALDSIDAMLAGGNNGPALVPGDASASSMVVNIALPLDDEYHMPPVDEVQVTEAELAVLRWWIDTGASESLLLEEAELPVEFAVAAAPPEDVADSTDTEESPTQEPELTLRESIEVLRARFSETFPGALTWVAEDTDALTFTAVSYRDTFGDAELAQLMDVAPHLLSVNLSATQVTDAGLDALLPELLRIEHLDLSNTATSGKPLLKLPPSAPVRMLNLFNTRVDDGTAIILGQQKGLERLYLGQTNVGETVLEGLRTALPNCEVVGAYTTPTDTPAAPAPADATSSEDAPPKDE